MVRLDSQKQNIAEKNFEFAKAIAQLCGDEESKKESIDLLKTHVYPTLEGRLYFSIDSIHELIARKGWMIYQENKTTALNFLKLPILEQLRKIREERELDPKILKKVKKEVGPWLDKFLKLKQQIPSPFDQRWIISDSCSLQNIYNYNLLILKSKRIDNLSEIDKAMISLNYYLMLIEGLFEDKIDFIFALIFLVDGKISIPSKYLRKQKVIKKISDVLDNNFTLGWKKAGLDHYKMPYLSQCLDIKLRNQIAHLKYTINDSGQIFLEDGIELKLKNLLNKQTELMHVIDSLNEIFLEPQLDVVTPGIEKIVENICEMVKKGTNPLSD
ncbi:MAG TPA: hypothetical protein VMW67_02725 [Desulfobacteria bacterium]|nr:hypothetical protein [Desulfobacteria bacterium]